MCVKHLNQNQSFADVPLVCHTNQLHYDWLSIQYSLFQCRAEVQAGFEEETELILEYDSEFTFRFSTLCPYNCIGPTLFWAQEGENRILSNRMIHGAPACHHSI